MDQKLNQEAAWRELEYLASNGKLLLFVDNVDKSMSDDAGLQKLNTIPGAIILTSRQVSFSDEFEAYPIGFLDTKQCMELFERIRFKGSERKISIEEITDLEYVIETLAGKHTITVELLAHLACTKLWTVKRLKEELEQKGFRLEFHKDGELVNIQKSYEVLYDLSELTEKEQKILEAFSVFPYIPLAAETCNEWLLAHAGVSEKDDILMRLYQKGWLQFDIKQESYALHPVFAQFIFEKCKPKGEKYRGLIESCQKCLEIPESGSALECQKYIPFAESIVEKLDIEKSLKQVDFIGVLAYLLSYLAEYERAEKWYKLVLEICAEICGEYDLVTVKYGDFLAGVYEELGQYENALKIFQKSLNIYQGLYGDENIDTARGYSNLAGIYVRLGKYLEAEKMFIKSLNICEIILEENHSDLARSYNNLAYVYMEEGKYTRAKELYEKCLSISIRVNGEICSNTATVYDNLAKVYEKQKKYKEAMSLYEKSLNIFRKVYGENHPKTVRIYNNLAGVYREHGEYETAEKLYKISLKVLEKKYGENHPDTATVYDNLAVLYTKRGECEKALGLYEKSMAIREEVCGKNHPITASSYNNMAAMYYNLKYYRKALLWFIQAYRIQIDTLGLTHPNTDITYHNMNITYSEWNPEGNFEQWLEEQMQE